MNSRLAVLMVADIVDYARLMSEDETAAIRAVRELKENHLEPVALEHGGEILKRMGDGWIIAFSSVTAAVQCATKVQDRLVGHPVITLRIGAHIGEIVEDENDFFGAGVNLAARLQTEAPPGGLMISQDLHRQLTGEMAKSFKDAGNFKLKNIAMPVNGFQWRPQRRGTPETGDVPTISIELFECAPDDGETRAAAADLRDQLIQRFSRRTGVRVLDDTSGGSKKPVYLMRGRLRISGNRGRLYLALILREDRRAVWSQTYDGETTDIFRFCDDLIERAEVDLRFQINAFDGDRISHLPDDELSVSELRSRAAASFYKGTVEDYEYAHLLMDRALRLNPADPMALAMRAEAVVILAAARYQELDAEQVSRLGADLNRALETAPRSDYISYTRGLFRVYAGHDAAGALQDAQRTLSLSPAYPLASELQGLALLLAGRFDEAAENLEIAVARSESDTLLPYRLYLLTIGLLCAGQPGKAVATIDRAIQLRSSQRRFHTLRAICCRGMDDEASARESDDFASLLPNGPSILSPRPPLPAEHADLARQLSQG